MYIYIIIYKIHPGTGFFLSVIRMVGSLGMWHTTGFSQVPFVAERPFRTRWVCLSWFIWISGCHPLTNTGWWYQPTPLKNDGVRQLGWWNSQLNGKIGKINFMFQTTNQESFWGIAIHNGPSGKICSESFPETGTETLGYTAVATSRSTAASMTRFRRSIDTNIVWLQTNLSMPRSNSGFQGMGQVNQIKNMRLLSFCDVHGCSFDVHSCSLICMDLLGALVDESLHQILVRYPQWFSHTCV